MVSYYNTVHIYICEIMSAICQDILKTTLYINTCYWCIYLKLVIISNKKREKIAKILIALNYFKNAFNNYVSSILLLTILSHFYSIIAYTYSIFRKNIKIKHSFINVQRLNTIVWSKHAEKCIATNKLLGRHLGGTEFELVHPSTFVSTIGLDPRSLDLNI